MNNLNHHLAPALPSFNEVERADHIIDIDMILQEACQSNISSPNLLQLLKEEYNIDWTPRQLKYRLAKLNLHTYQHVQYTDKKKAEIIGQIKLCHTRGLQKKEVVNYIQRVCETPEFTNNKLKTLCQEMGLNWRKDDIELGLASMEEVEDQMRLEVEGSRATAGIRSMQKGFAIDHGLKISRNTVHSMMQALYPEGLEERHRRKLHRRLYDVPGPNFVWSMDGHDKLKPFGICIYGAIDSWSRKVLKLHVATNNNDPRRIGVQFLRTVEEMGVCPQKVTTDKGSETGDIATFQITFLHIIGGLDWDEAEGRHRFTTSQHNQRIEQLWGQLMIQKNITIRDFIINAMFEGIYDPKQAIQKALFLHLFIRLVQRILDSFILERNFNRIAKQKSSLVPTGVSPEVCHYAPEKYKGTEGGLEVCKEFVQKLIAHYYPDEDTLFQITPPIFSSTVSKIIDQLGFIESEITLNNVWAVFTAVLDILKYMNVDLDEFPEGILNSDGEYEEYDRVNRFSVSGSTVDDDQN